MLMTGRLWVLCCVVNGFAAAAPPALDMMVLTDGPKLRRSDPWPEASPIFDPRTRQVSLAAARNETLGFELLLRPASGNHRTSAVTVSADSFIGPNGARIEKSNFELLRAWFVRVQEPSYTGGIRGLGPGEYPDPLVPLDSPVYGMPFDVERPEMLFIDIRVPPATPAGEYKSEITILSGSEIVERLPIRLQVWNFALPEETHFRNWFAYEPEFVRWGFRNPSPQRFAAIEEQLFRLAWRHRANLVPYTTLKPSAAEWDAWGKTYAKYLDGDIYKDSPGKSLGNYFWRLGFDPAEPKASLRPKLKLAADWLEKRGWLEKFVLVCFDEPKPQQYEAVKDAGEIARDATNGRLKHFLPGAQPAPAFRDYVDVWDGVWVAEDLEALAQRRSAGQQIWFCGGLGAPPNPVIDSLPYSARAWAWVGWKYAFAGFEMWQSCYWIDKYNTPRGQRGEIDRDPESRMNVWKNPAPLTFDESRKRDGRRREDDILQNGGGVFFYPGVEMGLAEQSIVSLRLKDFRRGVQDYEYLYLLRKQGETKLIEEALRAIYNPAAITLRRGGSPEVSTGDLGVTMDEAVWEGTRRKMGEFLSREANSH